MHQQPILSTVLWLCALCAAATSTRADERPNIVFLMADDQCSYSLGCYGNTDVKTPNIDQLAAEGMRFDRHYVTTAICMASRANVMTGMYEHKTGCNFNHGPMLDRIWESSYPMLLRDAGYTTAFAGKFGFEVTPAPGEKKRLPKGDFDAWGGAPGQTHYETKRNASMAKYAKEFPHSTLSYAAFSQDFIHESSKKDVPFCLSISFKAPHRPVTPDPKFDDVYAGMTFLKPKNFGREHGKHLSAQSRQGRQYDRFYSWHYADDYDNVMAKYNQQCYAIDVAVGRIREALKSAGVHDNTVIIYTSDNGFLCGSHGYGSKVIPYEESTRVPLVMFDPRVASNEQNRYSESLTGSIDFAPTILDLAGIEVPSTMDGRSLVPIYESANTDIHESLMLTNAWGPAPNQSLSIVTDEWKYIYWYFGDKDDASGFTPTEELFDVKHDPLELHNRTNDATATHALEKLRTHYDKAVEDWRTNGVRHHRYQHYATLFDRHMKWADKSALIKSIDQPKGD